jgi:hypothetical protein
MKFIISIFIFCVVLFIYLHIQFQLKTSNDLEIYEIDDVSKTKLEEVCDMRQPLFFDYQNDKIIEMSNRKFIEENYHAFEIKIRNSKETENERENGLYLPLPLHASLKLFNEDKNAAYFTENNADFLEETGIIKSFKYNDEFLRPFMVSNCNYDIMMGSNNTRTPFRYMVNYRNYFLLTYGTAKIKIAPPQSIKYLYPKYDYENFEFSSPINPWDVQAKYSADFDKMKCLEFDLVPGKILYLPSYWWYSIQFGENTCISCFYYRTYMNNIAILPYLSLHALQIQNVKRNIVKKIDETIVDPTIQKIVPNNTNEIRYDPSTEKNIDTTTNEVNPQSGVIQEPESIQETKVIKETNISDLPI